MPHLCSNHDFPVSLMRFNTKDTGFGASGSSSPGCVNLGESSSFLSLSFLLLETGANSNSHICHYGEQMRWYVRKSFEHHAAYVWWLSEVVFQALFLPHCAFHCISGPGVRALASCCHGHLAWASTWQQTHRHWHVHAAAVHGNKHTWWLLTV